MASLVDIDVRTKIISRNQARQCAGWCTPDLKLRKQALNTRVDMENLQVYPFFWFNR